MRRGIRHSTRRLRHALGALAVALLVVPASAHAGNAISVQITSIAIPGAGTSTVLYANGDHTSNTIVATYLPDGGGPGVHQLRLTSDGATDVSYVPNGSYPGACAQTDSQTVTCTASLIPSPRRWVLYGAAGDEEIRVDGAAVPSGTNVWLWGGLGDDLLVGGAGNERYIGDDDAGGTGCIHAGGTATCADEIRDGLGQDIVSGGGGGDTLVQSTLAGATGDLDRDTVDLGSGGTVTYAARTASEPLTVKVGYQSGTGIEQDELSGVNTVIGGAGNDTFRYEDGYLYVADGVRYEGGPGNDEFWPSPESEETFVGGAGADTVRYDEDSAAITYVSVVASANGAADDVASIAGPTSTVADNIHADIERILGTTGGDQLTGAAIAGCRLAGGGGNDTLTAPATGCILEGGDDLDTLNGGAGNDVMRPGTSSTSGSDAITFGGGTDTADYGTPSLLSGSTGINGVFASASPSPTAWCQDDKGTKLGVQGISASKVVGAERHRDWWADAPERIVGTATTDRLCGGPAGTTLEGGDGPDYIYGGAGPDLMYGGTGNDFMFGQAGNDQVYGQDGADFVNGGAGADYVDGGSGDDPHVQGGGGSDTILGGPGNDTLDEVTYSTLMQGQPGDELDAGDVLDGGPGIDTIDGASGDDVMACTGESLQDTWTDSGGGTEVFDCRGIPYPIAYSAGAGIDQLIGTAHGDSLGGAPVIDGFLGNDTIYAIPGGTAVGSWGDDRLVGSGAGETLDGGPGNDTLEGGEGSDTLVGGDGNDALYGGGGDDTLDGGGGGDLLSGGPGTEVVSYAGRGGGVNVSRDGAANDGQPGEGDNVLEDVEELVGTGFNDRLSAGSSGATLRGEGGNDTLVGSPQPDFLYGGDGNDRLAAGGSGDFLYGDGGNDTLLAGGGNDKMFGGTGNDMLDGGFGRDLFAGGGGIDTASYRTRRKPVIVTLGIGRWNDGERREGDHIGVDVENVFGGRSHDRITGSVRNNLLRGGPGNDRIIGNHGLDRIFGDAGNDYIDARDKLLRDQRRREIIIGGSGRDRVLADVRDRVIGAELRKRYKLRWYKVKRRVRR